MSQLFDLYRVHRGKRTLMMTGERPAVCSRMARLRKDSHRIDGQAVRYVMELAAVSAEKFVRAPDSHRRSGGDAQTPRLTKWKG